MSAALYPFEGLTGFGNVHWLQLITAVISMIMLAGVEYSRVKYAVFLQNKSGLLLTASSVQLAKPNRIGKAFIITVLVVQHITSGGSRVLSGWISDHRGNHEVSMGIAFVKNAILCFHLDSCSDIYPTRLEKSSRCFLPCSLD